jgi:hypothetical protein
MAVKAKHPPIYHHQWVEAARPFWPKRGALIEVELEPIAERTSLSEWKARVMLQMEQPWAYLQSGCCDELDSSDPSYKAASDLLQQLQWMRAVTELPVEAVAGALRRLLGIAPVQRDGLFLFSATELLVAGSALWSDHPHRQGYVEQVHAANFRLEQQQRAVKLLGELSAELDG